MTEGEMVGGITNSMVMRLGNLWELVLYLEDWHNALQGVTKSST